MLPETSIEVLFSNLAEQRAISARASAKVDPRPRRYRPRDADKARLLRRIGVAEALIGPVKGQVTRQRERRDGQVMIEESH